MVQEAGICAPGATIAVGMDVCGRAHSAMAPDGVGSEAAGLGRGDERAGDGGLAGDLAFDGGDAAHLAGVGTPVEDGDFDAELVAGDDGAAEFGGVDAGEDHELVLAVGDLGEQQRAAGLRDGLDHQDAGHDGVVGEVAGEVRLVGGDVLDGDDARLALHLDDAVDEQEGIAVREDGHDLDDVHGVAGRVWAGRSWQR